LGDFGFSTNGIPVYGPSEDSMHGPFAEPSENAVMDVSQEHARGNEGYLRHAFVEASFRDSDGDGRWIR